MKKLARTSTFLLKFWVYIMIFLVVIIGILLFRAVSSTKEVQTPRTAEERMIYDATLAVKANPKSAKAHTRLAQAYYTGKLYKKALAEAETAISLDKELPEAYYWAGVSAKALKDYKLANNYLIKATKIEGDFAPLYREAWYELGTMYLDLKRYKDAVTALEEALGFGPEYTYVGKALAEAYEKAGMKEKALEELKALAEYNPTDASIMEDIDRLNKELSKEEGGK